MISPGDEIRQRACTEQIGNLDYEIDRYGKQFKYADERKIRYAMLVSPREIEARVVAIKDLVSGEQVDMPAAATLAWLQENLAS